MSEQDAQTEPAFAAEFADVLDGADSPKEPPARSNFENRLYAVLAFLLAIGFLLANWIYLVPAHAGVDQNGYLVGGRMLAQNLTMRQAPVKPGSNQFDPHQFVGRMWVGADLGTPQERYYPKYPLGLPMLVAVALWVGGDTWGPTFAYWINPIAMTLAVGATFLLVKQVANSFWAFCGEAIFATSPLVMGLTTNPNSHATAVCSVAWGMYLLLRWWQKRGVWRALLAGLLLGYAGIIRYSEGLLVLPLLAVLVMNCRWREKRAWVESFWALAGWAIPIGILAWYNYAAMGRITGYDGTNESIGFSWQYALENWETMLRQLGTFSLYFTFPFAVIGLLTMFCRNWRMGVVLAAWTLPCIVTYIFYYWAPDPQQLQGTFVSYMRFIVTVVPGLVMAACWFFDQTGRFLQVHAVPPWAFRMSQVGFGAVILIAVAVQLQNGTLGAEIDQNSRLIIKCNADQVLATAPAGAVLFVTDSNLLSHIQFLRDYNLYTGETFNKSFVDSLPRMDPDEPQGWEPGRRDALYARLKNLTQAQLDDEQRRLMTAALDSGRRVFFLIRRRDNDPPVGRRFSGEARGAFPAADPVRRFATVDRFDIQVASAWCTPIVRSIPPGTVRTRKQRAEMRVDRQSTLWQMIEVFRRPPAPPAPPAPATRPASSASTRPATLPATTRSAQTRPAATRPTTTTRSATTGPK